MPQHYAKLGTSIGDILGTALEGGSEKGFSKGVDAGSNYMLRSTQAAKNLGDYEKVMYELDQARRGDATTGKDIAIASGVPDYMAQALNLGETSTPSLNPAAPDTPIPQGMQDRFTNSTMLKVLQQLSGGVQSGANADTLASAMLKGQEFNTRGNMQTGVQDTGDVASAEAALQGKLPGRTGAGGGVTTAKVQQLSALTAAFKRQGLSPVAAEAKAIAQVFGADLETKSMDKLLQSLVSSGMYEPSEIEQMLPYLRDARKNVLNPEAPKGDDPLGLR